MLYTVEYQTEQDRENIINNNRDKYLIEEKNIAEGNYLVFTDMKTIQTEMNELKSENHLLKAQNNALVERADFVEDLIAEMAMEIYQ